MRYQFAKERPDYSDLASGRVFYSLPGHPAFPIRLADEILQRCLARRAANHLTGSCVLYDPCCGAAYQLAVLGYLHWHSFREIVGSDMDQKVISLAQKNLGLLSVEGLEKGSAKSLKCSGSMERCRTKKHWKAHIVSRTE